MEMNRNPSINKSDMDIALIEIKLVVNRRLYEKGYITERMYTKANEIILREKAA